MSRPVGFDMTLNRLATKEESFWLKIEVTPGCWKWKGRLNKYGYPTFKKCDLAHRFSYEIHKGKIPEGLTLDHLCRNPSCTNPEHLEAVSSKENVLRGNAPSAMNKRKTHCKNGHQFNETNTYNYIDSKDRVHRTCRVCHKMNEQKRRRKHP